MYLQSLSDLPPDRLDEAFQRAVRECRFFPTIAEIRGFESQVQVSPERLEAAHQRLLARIAAQPEVKMLASVLDEKPVMPKRKARQPIQEELERRMDELLKQREQLLKPK